MSTKNWLRFIALGLIWGTSFLWIKIAVAEVSPAVLAAYRTLFGAFGLAVVLWGPRKDRPTWASLRPWLGTFALGGLLNMALPFVVISWAEQYIDSGIAAILNSTVPLFTIILAPLFLHDDPFTLPKALGLLTGFGGVVVLFLPELSHGVVDQSLLGHAAMLLATLSYAAGGIFVRARARKASPPVQSFLQLTSATIFLWAFAFAGGGAVIIPQLPLTWVALLWLGLLGACVAFLLYFALLHAIGPTRTTMVTYIPPLVGVLLGAIFLQEQLTWAAVLGGLLIISGIAVVNFWKR